jgi:hypothetical protein
LYPPTRIHFLKLLKYTLTKFSIFRTRIGVFQQIDGLSMGSCLSTIISNFFVNMLEKDVVTKFEKSVDLILWVRYADDVFIIVKKGSYNEIFKNINKWDYNLSFTSEEMVHNSLIFPDCEIFIENSKIDFKNFRKFGTETIFSNYQKSLMPKRYLISNIFT